MDEDTEVAEDLTVLDDAPIDVRFPEEEPRPNSIYEYADDFLGVEADAFQSERQLRGKLEILRRRKLSEERAWAGATGFATRPKYTRVVPLDRKKYDATQAWERFRELQTKNNWKTVGEPFWTARFWCWRIAC